MGILIPAMLSLGGLSIIFALGLGLAAKKFAVKVDPKVEEILETLPGTNCGACGYPGCAGAAEAIASGVAPVNACTAGGPGTAQAVAAIMGVEAETSEEVRAVVGCQGSPWVVKERFHYQGIPDCQAAILLRGGPKGCIYGCLGLGSCEKVCPFDAIHIGPQGLPVVDIDKCTGCGKCVSVCPNNILFLAPMSKTVYVGCVSQDKGKAVKEICGKGCIACQICVRKACKFDAIHMQGNLPVIDYNKCTNCGQCAVMCPTGSIVDTLAPRMKARIDPEKCIGCTICAKICKFEAISGEKKQVHTIEPEKCVGCGMCLPKCPKKAITQDVPLP